MESDALLVDVEAALAQSRTCIAANRASLRTSRYRIAASRRRLNPAFACCGGSVDEGSLPGSVPRGVIFGPLAEVHADRIAIGDRVFYFSDGLVCRLTAGTYVVVEYTERDGRREVRTIERREPSR